MITVKYCTVVIHFEGNTSPDITNTVSVIRCWTPTADECNSPQVHAETANVCQQIINGNWRLRHCQVLCQWLNLDHSYI